MCNGARVLAYYVSILDFENFKTFKGFSVPFNLQWTFTLLIKLAKLNLYIFV